MNKTLLVTGAAGFIGSHVTQALLVRGDTVVLAWITSGSDVKSTPLIERPILNPASLSELSVQDKFTSPRDTAVARRLVGAIGVD